MARNGLFADDGRVRDLAAAIKLRLMGIANDFTGVNDRHNLLKNRVDGHDVALSDAARDLGLTNVELASLTGLINAKATRAETNELKGRLDAYPTPAALENDIADLYANDVALGGRIDEVTARTLPVFGKMAKVDGFQTISEGPIDDGGGDYPGWAKIRMAQDYEAGGVTFHNEHGGMLKVPVEGYYLIILNAYFTGSSNWMGAMRAGIYDPSGVRTHNTGNAMTWKPNQMDYSISRSEVGYFYQGTGITLEGSSLRGDGTSNVSGQATWGSTSRTGTTCMVIKL